VPGVCTPRRCPSTPPSAGHGKGRDVGVWAIGGSQVGDVAADDEMAHGAEAAYSIRTTALKLTVYVGSVSVLRHEPYAHGCWSRFDQHRSLLRVIGQP
jgi:hypothetical protein